MSLERPRAWLLLDVRLVVFALNKKISSYLEISCKIWVKIASKSVLKCLFNLDV